MGVRCRSEYRLYSEEKGWRDPDIRVCAVAYDILAFGLKAFLLGCVLRLL